MRDSQLIAVALIVLGVLALVHGDFSYTPDTHEANLSLLSLSAESKERVNIPSWAGAGSVLIGGLLFFFGRFSR